MDDETLTVNIAVWQALLAAPAGRHEGQECSECSSLSYGRPALPAGPAASPTHTGFFMEVLKGRSLRSARPYRLNSFLPLQAQTAQPRLGGAPKRGQIRSLAPHACSSIHTMHRCSPLPSNAEVWQSRNSSNAFLMGQRLNLPCDLQKIPALSLWPLDEFEL